MTKLKFRLKKCFIKTNRKLKLTTLCVCSVLPIISLFFKEICNILSELVTITNLMSKFYETFFCILPFRYKCLCVSESLTDQII